MEDLRKRGAMICYRHQVCNRLKKKCIRTQNPFIFKYKKTRGHDNATTNPLLQQVALLWILRLQTKQGWKRKRIVCYKPRNLKHRGMSRKPKYLLKLHSRELSSTIDRYKNGENAYIYSEQSTIVEPRQCIESFVSAWLLTVNLWRVVQLKSDAI